MNRMVLEKFSIVLDNPVKVFFPGQLVTGNVQITITDQPEEIAKSKLNHIDFQVPSFNYSLIHDRHNS